MQVFQQVLCSYFCPQTSYPAGSSHLIVFITVIKKYGTISGPKIFG